MAAGQSELIVESSPSASNILLDGFLDGSERRLPDSHEFKIISGFGDTALQHLVVQVVLPSSEPISPDHPYVKWSKDARALQNVGATTSLRQRTALHDALEASSDESYAYRDALSAAAGYEHRYQTHYHDKISGKINHERIVKLVDQTEALETLEALAMIIRIHSLKNPNLYKKTKDAERLVRIIGLDALHLIK